LRETCCRDPRLSTRRDESGDIDEFDDRGNGFFRFRDVDQRLQPRIRHFDDPDVRLYRAKRVVLRRNAGLGQRIEQGGLADIRQTDDSAFETHDVRCKCESTRAAT